MLPCNKSLLRKYAQAFVAVLGYMPLVLIKLSRSRVSFGQVNKIELIVQYLGYDSSATIDTQ